ncbi:GntR family transcriptional regulator [Brevibacterium sp. 50QC2O2]|uniref:GntR family transcriptional regulator n=1 Tax=Brevibacterium sp. 50QC2O2 TaxID=2968459 RepID=UPI00211C4E48|nr:GntR family transcriptional regulator [Brevibacterium sp. 50QC2O2]MCQ9388198.1 GntR family transcriptional regulator [Brevibacterium sp. 50QC2O2]
MTSIFPGVPQKLQRRGLRDEVYEQLLDLLQSDTMPAGTKLSIDGLARELDVSPTPVREALVKLEATHLIERRALRGYTVAEPLSAGQIADLSEVRKALEVAAGGLAIANPAELFPGLDDAHETHRIASERVIGSAVPVPLELTKAYFAADKAFHMAIMRATGNPYLLETYTGIGALTNRMRQSAHSGPDDVREAAIEHSAILTALHAGDAAAAMAAAAAHVDNVRDRSIASIR